MQTDYPRVNIDGRDYLLICKSTDIYEKKGRRFEFGEEIEKQVAVFRYSGKLYALSNICPHRHQDQIYNGIIRDSMVTCPVHGWTYFLESGKNINQNQGIKNLEKYEIFEKDGSVFLEIPEFESPRWKDYLE
jgi:nitrite reductase/ring-hydroxylating ferredoxin subunit